MRTTPATPRRGRRDGVRPPGTAPPVVRTPVPPHGPHGSATGRLAHPLGQSRPLEIGRLRLAERSERDARPRPRDRKPPPKSRPLPPRGPRVQRPRTPRHGVEDQPTLQIRHHAATTGESASRTQPSATPFGNGRAMVTRGSWPPTSGTSRVPVGAGCARHGSHRSSTSTSTLPLPGRRDLAPVHGDARDPLLGPRHARTANRRKTMSSPDHDVDDARADLRGCFTRCLVGVDVRRYPSPQS